MVDQAETCSDYEKVKKFLQYLCVCVCVCENYKHSFSNKSTCFVLFLYTLCETLNKITIFLQ